MKKLLMVCFLVSGIALSGCSARIAKFNSLGNDHKLTLYSGGVKIGEWISDGKVLSEETSDGYYFKEKSTGKSFEISGDIIIEIIPN